MTATSGALLCICCLSLRQCTAVSGRPLPWPRAHYSVSVASAMVSALLFGGALCHGQGHITLCLLPRQRSVHCCFRAPSAVGTRGHHSEGGGTLHRLLLRLVFLLCTSSCFFFSSHTFLAHNTDASLKKQDTSVLVEIQWGKSKCRLEPSRTWIACISGLSTTATRKTVLTSDFIAKKGSDKSEFIVKNKFRLCLFLDTKIIWINHTGKEVRSTSQKVPKMVPNTSHQITNKKLVLDTV